MSLVYKEVYANRKKTIERVFADAKEKHGLRFTQLRGLLLAPGRNDHLGIN